MDGWAQNHPGNETWTDNEGQLMYRLHQFYYCQRWVRFWITMKRKLQVNDCFISWANWNMYTIKLKGNKEVYGKIFTKEFII